MRSEMIAFNWNVLEWPGMNTAFLTSFIASNILTFAVMAYGRRRPVGKPTSWGEAMIGSTYAFGVMFLAFGIVPHQWIDHADKDLGWDRSKIIFGPGGILKPKAFDGWFPFTLQYEAIRDVIVVVLHAYYFGLLIFIWIWWQKRGESVAKELPTSSYGRPLVRKA